VDSRSKLSPNSQQPKVYEMLFRKLTEAEFGIFTVYAVIRKHVLIWPAGYMIL
jgi:hypothetical protein